MIRREDLKKKAREHLRSARILRRSKAYDSAVYLCGYAVEMALKARICQALRWTEFPETAAEFKGKTSLKTHDLDSLLDFTGIQARVRQPPLNTEWATAKLWNPEQRYRPVGANSANDADDMIAATQKLLDILL